MSIFSDEWRACLCEQYKYVVRNNDARTLETLTEVMHDVGFGDDELKQLQIQATMRTEDMPEDYQPDLNILEPTVYPVAAIEETLADDDSAEVVLTAEELLAMEAEIEAEQESIDMEADANSADTTDEGESDVENDSDDSPDADAPVQLSLFG